ncbi:hypothetical protein JCM9279_000871 [Rhodotorula babjevae]
MSDNPSYTLPSSEDGTRRNPSRKPSRRGSVAQALLDQIREKTPAKSRRLEQDVEHGQRAKGRAASTKKGEGRIGGDGGGPRPAQPLAGAPIVDSAREGQAGVRTTGPPASAPSAGQLRPLPVPPVLDPINVDPAAGLSAALPPTPPVGLDGFRADSVTDILQDLEDPSTSSSFDELFTAGASLAMNSSLWQECTPSSVVAMGEQAAFCSPTLVSASASSSTPSSAAVVPSGPPSGASSASTGVGPPGSRRPPPPSPPPPPPPFAVGGPGPSTAPAAPSTLGSPLSSVWLPEITRVRAHNPTLSRAQQRASALEHAVLVVVFYGLCSQS